MNMRRKGFVKSVLGLLAASTLTMSVAGAALAQTPPARDAQWSVSITYQNLGTAATPVTIDFYQENTAAKTTQTQQTLNAGAATSFFVGNVQGGTFTQGNAVMSSEQQLAATVVQFSAPGAPNQQDYIMRLLYNGFPDNKSSNQYLVATTLLNRFQRTTVFSVQNTETEPINVNIKYYDADANGALAGESNFQLPANGARFIEMDSADDVGAIANRPAFNGSAIVTAQTAGGAAAQVVAAASEYYVDRPVATNFEGVPLSDAANLIYMATALCQRFGLDTFYAIQNASLDASATITIRYFDLNGTQVSQDGPRQIGAGQKYSANTCQPSQNAGAMPNFTGSATIESQGAPIVAIGKAQKSVPLPPDPRFDLVLTAFLGEKQGYEDIALPFVRWASDDRFNASKGGEQRTFIAIQNVGDAPVSGVQIHYRDKNGATVATVNAPAIPSKSKFNTDANAANALGQNGMRPGEFGYYTDNSFGGGVFIDGPEGAQLIAIARVQNPGAGEDYNGVPTP